MKVMQVLPQLNFGGVEVGTVDLAQSLIERGHKAYVVSAGGALVGRLVKMGARHIELPVHKKSILKVLAMAKVLRGIIEREGIDVVHARSRVPALIAFFATRRSRAKFVTTCHGYYSNHMLSSVMGWGERVIVISRAVGRRMIDTFGVLPDKITLIHRGLDPAKYEFDKDKYANERIRGKEKFVIANIGRLTKIKGHEYFIKAIHLASHTYPHIEAWIVGGASPKKQKYVDELKTLVAKLGIENMVVFKGVEKNVPELLKKVDMLVLSTTYPEGFGRVIIEAGAAGVPVVATKVGGVPDIIEDGKNGILVPPEDEVKMSEAIIRVLREPAKTRLMTQSLRKKVERDFTVEKMIDKTIEVYNDVRESKRILVMKLGALGDIILAVPSLRMLRKKYPKGHIAVLVDASLTACLEHCPYIDEVIPYKRKDKKNRFRNMKNVIRKIRRHSFDLSIDFQNNTQTHLIAYFSGIPRRYGYKRGFFGRFLTHGVGSFKDPLPPVQHQFRVLSLLGFTECDERLELWPQKEERDYVDYCVDSKWEENKKPLIGLVLGASARWSSKRWPIDNFKKLARRLIDSADCRIVLIGDNTSAELRDALGMSEDPDVLDMIGRTSIPQLAALMQKLDTVVCGDTAPLHVAAAMKTKIVALFGPTDPRRHMSPGPRNKLIKRNLSCAPCYKEACPNEHRCMKDISVDEVYQALQHSVSV